MSSFKTGAQFFFVTIGFTIDFQLCAVFIQGMKKTSNHKYYDHVPNHKITFKNRRSEIKIKMRKSNN